MAAETDVDAVSLLGVVFVLIDRVCVMNVVVVRFFHPGSKSRVNGEITRLKTERTANKLKCR